MRGVSWEVISLPPEEHQPRKTRMVEKLEPYIHEPSGFLVNLFDARRCRHS
jgi:hypothetical protein